MLCPFCNNQLPEGARFCNKCHKQIVCLYCGKELVEDSDICVFCGENIKSSVKEAGCVNHIKFVEDEKGKSFETSFSNETAENVASIFVQLIPGIRRPQLQYEGSYIEKEEKEVDCQTNYELDVLPEIQNINRIFREKDGSVFLVEKRLKAKSKSDYQARACLLFMLFSQTNGTPAISRDALTSFMNGEKLSDGNFRAWLSHNSRLFIKVGDDLELSNEGKEMAQKYLFELFDDTIENQWSPNSAIVSTKKIRSNSKGKGTKTALPKMIDDLDLAPKGKDSLEAFMKKHKYRKSASQQNLLFVYYLKNVLGVPQVNQDYLFTCYRKLGFKLPKDLYHSISDTISKNRWLINASNLTLTNEGTNYVEQNMKTNDA